MTKLKALFCLELVLFFVLSVLSYLRPPAVRAQSGYVNVIGTVGTYAGGQLTGSFKNQSTLPQLPLLNGSTFATTAILNLDVNGFFSGAIADNGIITPTPSVWHFVLCWKTGNPSNPCFPVDIPITCVNNSACVNGTLDISSYFANAPPPNAITQPITSPIINGVRIVGSASTTDLGLEINNAFAGCGSYCEVDVRVINGQYPWLTTAVINTNTQLIKGLGPKGAVIGHYTGSGDAVLYQTNPFIGPTNVFSGGIENLTILGTSAGRSGIHTGNVVGGHLYNDTVQGFTGAAGKCIWIDNTRDINNHGGWYERNTWIGVSLGNNFGLPLQQCTYGVYADNNNATNSLGYNRILDLNMNVNPGQYGIYLDGSTGQVFWYNGTLNTNANINSGFGQSGSIPEFVHVSNNSQMVNNQVKIDGENNCISGQSCDATTAYGIHVASGGQFLNNGASSFLGQLGVLNENNTAIDTLAFTGDFPFNTLVSTDPTDIVIATGPQLTGTYWIWANGTHGSNRAHGMEVKIGAERFDAHYTLSVPMQYAFNNQVVLSNPRIVYDANSLPQLIVTVSNINGQPVQMYAKYYGTQDHIPTLLNGATVGTTAATTTYSEMVDPVGNVVNGQNYQATRVAVTDCLQLAAAGDCVVKSVTTPISADGTVILADTTSNLTGRYVISWSSPNRFHEIIADVGATRFDGAYSMTKAVDYAFTGQQVLTGLAVLSDANSDPQLQVTIGNRNDGSNPDNLTVTWYGDAANSPNLLPTDTLGTTARNNRQSAGTLRGTSPSLGGSALAAGACASNTTTINTAASGMVPSASPVTDPGAGFYWKAVVTGANTVTTSVCAAIAGTPTASVYNIVVSE